VEESARQLGWTHAERDWRKVIENPEIDVIDVSTPGNLHAPMAIAAAEAGKAVWCEKPLGNSLAEAQAMVEAVTRTGVAHGLFHNYRAVPAIQLLRRIVEDGRIGEIYHFRAVYLQDWILSPSFPRVWRLQKSQTGSGAHGDLNAHLIDLAHFLVGGISEVSGLMRTFITERPLPDDPSKTGEVDVDDAALALLRFESGAIGSIEASRFAAGRKNYNCIEVNGSKGSAVFNLERMNELQFFDRTAADDAQGFTVINVTDQPHPYGGTYWPSGHIIGYEHTFINLVAGFIQAMECGEPLNPNFNDGLRTQRVLEAVERSHESRAWVATV
jgi:predicted dehydrogenase